MTDRAAVMKRFDADFLQFIRTQVGKETVVHFLHCNAHYLLGLSRSTELALQATEKVRVFHLIETSRQSFAFLSQKKLQHPC